MFDVYNMTDQLACVSFEIVFAEGEDFIGVHGVEAHVIVSTLPPNNGNAALQKKSCGFRG